MIYGIVAMAKNGVIGVDGKIPWHIKEDMAFFKKVTSSHTVVMGGNTYRSIGKPLPNRRNIVISNTIKDDRIEIWNNSFIDFVNAVNYLSSDVFIIGGAKIYDLYFDVIQGWYTTIIDRNIEITDNTTIFDGCRIENTFKAVSEIKLLDDCKVVEWVRK